MVIRSLSRSIAPRCIVPRCIVSRSIVTAAVCLVAVTAGVGCHAPETREALPRGSTSKFGDIVGAYHQFGQFDGAVLVIRAGEVVYSGAFGRANRTWDIENRPDTKFAICSVTKQFTAVLTLQLVGEGRIDLEEPVTRYLPWYRRDTGARITVRHLLQHMSGIPEPITEFDQIDEALAVAGTPRRLIEEFASGDLEFEPGTRFSYSNSDYYLLGAIIEATTGRSFADELRDRILDPLRMAESGLLRFEDVLPRSASGYQLADEDYEHRMLFGQLGYAAAGMYSTVEDLGKWNLALLEHRVLSKELTERMFTPAVIEGEGNYVGLGSWVYPRPLPAGRESSGADDVEAPRLVERRGYITPFTALNVLCPDQMHAFVILSNHDPCDIHKLPYASGLPLDLLLMLFGRDPEGPAPPQ